MRIDMEDAKTNLSDLVAAAERGEEVVITRNGTPAARLVAITGEHAPVRLGVLAGEIERSTRPHARRRVRQVWSTARVLTLEITRKRRPRGVEWRLCRSHADNGATRRAQRHNGSACALRKTTTLVGAGADCSCSSKGAVAARYVGWTAACF